MSKKISTDSRSAGLGTPDPVGDPRRARSPPSPAIAGSSPSRRPCNRARQPRAGYRRRAPERCEPAVFRAVRLAVVKDQRVVLVHRQQALAAAGGAQHRDRIGARRSALASSRMRRSAITAACAGERAELARDHRGDVAAGSPSATSAAATSRQLRPGGRERMHVRRLHRFRRRAKSPPRRAVAAGRAPRSPDHARRPRRSRRGGGHGAGSCGRSRDRRTHRPEPIASGRLIDLPTGSRQRRRRRDGPPRATGRAR